MKKISTLLIIVLISNFLFSQLSTNELLIVYIQPGWNKEKKVKYYTIYPDPGINAATDLYQLKSVRELLPADDDPDYYEKKKQRFKTINQDSIIYNYFETESAALNFIVSKKWKLLSVMTNVVTIEERAYTSNAYANTYTTPKYLFVRE